MNIHYSEALLLYMFHLIRLCVPNKTKRILYLVITCAILFINTRNLRSTSLILCQCLYIRQSQFRHNDFFCLILISNSSCNSRNHSNHCNFHGFLLHTTMCFFLNLLISFSPYLSFQRTGNHIPHQKKSLSLSLPPFFKGDGAPGAYLRQQIKRPGVSFYSFFLLCLEFSQPYTSKQINRLKVHPNQSYHFLTLYNTPIIKALRHSSYCATQSFIPLLPSPRA